MAANWVIAAHSAHDMFSKYRYHCCTALILKCGFLAECTLFLIMCCFYFHKAYILIDKLRLIINTLKVLNRLLDYHFYQSSCMSE